MRLRAPATVALAMALALAVAVGATVVLLDQEWFGALLVAGYAFPLVHAVCRRRVVWTILMGLIPWAISVYAFEAIFEAVDRTHPHRRGSLLDTTPRPAV